MENALSVQFNISVFSETLGPTPHLAADKAIKLRRRAAADRKYARLLQRCHDDHIGICSRDLPVDLIDDPARRPGGSDESNPSRALIEVGEVRGLGSMIGVEMVKDRATREPDPDYVSRLMAETQRRGLITVSCGVYHNVVRHLVPLVITDEQLDEGLDVLAESALAARS